MSTEHSLVGDRHSLGTRLVLATLGFCFVFTLLAVGARTWIAWNQAWNVMNSDLVLLEQVYQQTLSKTIWEMDRDALKTQVDSAAKAAGVGRVALTLQTTNRKPELIERVTDGWQPSSLAPTRRVDLVYEPFPGGAETVGVLSLAGDERVLWSSLRDELNGIILTQLLQSLLLAGLIMLLFNRTVTVHVQRIARHLEQLTPQTMGQTLQLLRHPRYRDELSLLESGVNQLQRKLTDHLTQLKHYEHELGTHRDHLAELVRARTKELESLTQAQQLVLSLSNRLIHAPHESFELCQQDCFIEVLQRSGAQHALWLVPLPAQPGFSVFFQWQAGPTSTTVRPLSLTDLTHVPTCLARENLLFFSSTDEMASSLSHAEAVVFSTQGVGACALALLHGDGETFGLIFIGKPPGESNWLPEERALIAMTAQMLLHSVRHKTQVTAIVATQVALREANHQLEILSRHDPLTGLFNRRHFDEVKEDEFQRAMRGHQTLSLMVCDIDCFKAYNDQYGHASGDQCLRDVARAMGAASVRNGDTLARIGGEEFAMLLPATRTDAACQVAERVRQAITALNIPHASSVVGGFVSVSIGVAEFDATRMTHFNALFEAADQALYRAKARGRNRIETWTEDSPVLD